MTTRLAEHKGWQILVKAAKMTPGEKIIEAVVDFAEGKNAKLADEVDRLRDQLCIAVGRAETAENKVSTVQAYRDTCAILRQEPSTAGLIRALKDDTAPVKRAHNHPPYEPICNERMVNGIIRGACLRNDGSDVE